MTKDPYIPKLNLLAIYQIAGGAIGLWIVIRLIASIQGFVLLHLLLFVFPVLAFAFSILAGVSLLQRETRSLKLSMINQCLQVLVLSGPIVSYMLVAGAGLIVKLDVSDGLQLSMGLQLPSFSLNIQNEEAERYLGANGIALGIIFYLRAEMRDIIRNKVRDQAESIGQDLVTDPSNDNNV